MSQELKDLQVLRKELSGFTKSKVHALFLKETSADLEAVEQRILEDDITSVEDLFTLLDVRGQRRVLRSNLSLFEDAVATLDNRIEQMILDEEQPSATQQETNEN